MKGRGEGAARCNEHQLLQLQVARTWAGCHFTEKLPLINVNLLEAQLPFALAPPTLSSAHPAGRTAGNVSA